MPTTSTLRCRECGRSPESRGDQVSDRAVAYLCCECLMGRNQRRKKGAAIPLQGRPDAPGPEPTESGSSKTIFRDGRASRPGRPRVALAEQQRKARERARAYRAGRPPATIPVP